MYAHRTYPKPNCHNKWMKFLWTKIISSIFFMISWRLWNKTGTSSVYLLWRKLSFLAWRKTKARIVWAWLQTNITHFAIFPAKEHSTKPKRKNTEKRDGYSTTMMITIVIRGHIRTEYEYRKLSCTIKYTLYLSVINQIRNCVRMRTMTMNDRLIHDNWVRYKFTCDLSSSSSSILLLLLLSILFSNYCRKMSSTCRWSIRKFHGHAHVNDNHQIIPTNTQYA